MKYEALVESLFIQTTQAEHLISVIAEEFLYEHCDEATRKRYGHRLYDLMTEVMKITPANPEWLRSLQRVSVASRYEEKRECGAGRGIIDNAASVAVVIPRTFKIPHGISEGTVLSRDIVNVEYTLETHLEFLRELMESLPKRG